MRAILHFENHGTEEQHLQVDPAIGQIVADRSGRLWTVAGIVRKGNQAEITCTLAEHLPAIHGDAIDSETTWS